MLERRLDNVVFSLGFASSRNQARQLVRHGHILVDGKKTTIPSYQVRAGQAISVQGVQPQERADPRQRRIGDRPGRPGVADAFRRELHRQGAVASEP